MRNIYLLISTTLIALLLSACGGGGGSSDASFDSGNRKITVVDCNNTTPIYTDIEDGDLLVKESDSTIVVIVHNTDGSKKVCADTGSAHLLRDN